MVRIEIKKVTNGQVMLGMQQLGRKAGKGGLRILSETQMEEKAAAAMAQLQEDTWAKRISTP